MIRTVLALCSRDLGHDAMYAQLEQALTTFHAQGGSWGQLIRHAERQGVASLLYKHTRFLDFAIPLNDRRSLQSLYLRNKRSNAIRNKAVSEIVKSCAMEEIELLLVKGIALCNFAYSEIGLRPMRDIDLLVKKEDLDRTEKIFVDLGYLPDGQHHIPNDYYHLVPMTKMIDGLTVSVEVHHNLLPFHPQYPLWPLEKSYDTSLEFRIHGTCCRTLCLEDTLWYVYLHGFQAPLTYEPFRLMHVADVVTLVEKFHGKIDWHGIRNEMPNLLNIVSRFHSLTPWQKNISDQLGLDIRHQPSRPGLPYCGWPLRKIKKVKRTQLLALVQDTLWPSRWWMQVYYGHLEGEGYWKARLLDHPRMVWRWVKAYWHAYRNDVKK